MPIMTSVLETINRSDGRDEI